MAKKRNINPPNYDVSLETIFWDEGKNTWCRSKIGMDDWKLTDAHPKTWNPKSNFYVLDNEWAELRKDQIDGKKIFELVDGGFQEVPADREFWRGANSPEKFRSAERVHKDTKTIATPVYTKEDLEYEKSLWQKDNSSNRRIWVRFKEPGAEWRVILAGDPGWNPANIYIAVDKWLTLKKAYFDGKQILQHAGFDKWRPLASGDQRFWTWGLSPMEFKVAEEVSASETCTSIDKSNTQETNMTKDNRGLVGGLTGVEDRLVKAISRRTYTRTSGNFAGDDRIILELIWRFVSLGPDWYYRFWDIKIRHYLYPNGCEARSSRDELRKRISDLTMHEKLDLLSILRKRPENNIWLLDECKRAFTDLYLEKLSGRRVFFRSNRYRIIFDANASSYNLFLLDKRKERNYRCKIGFTELGIV